ncbi:MAG: hypothetical protein ACYS5V_07155, partial [Planctomycetota bacterium]
AIKRFDWESGTIYDPYDDEEEDIINRTNKLYVLTDEGNVYKCIDRPPAAASTDKPTGQALGLTPTVDGYIWKYMFALDIFALQNLLTDDFIPVKKLYVDDGSSQWNVQNSAIDGTVDRVKIVSGGTGYVAPVVNVDAGDGVGFSATANVVGGVVTSITVNNAGSGYSFIELSISEGGHVGDVAEIKGVVAPAGGHGSDAVTELNAIYALVKVRLEESESGLLPTDISFRRVGIVLNPVTTDTSGVLLNVTAETGDFEIGNTVVGSPSGATGTVVFWDYNTQRLWLKDVTGAFGEETITSGSTTAQVDAINTSVNIPATELVYDGADILDDVGDLIYIENRLPIQRNDSQTEDIRLIVEF